MAQKDGDGDWDNTNTVGGGDESSACVMISPHQADNIYLNITNSIKLSSPASVSDLHRLKDDKQEAGLSFPPPPDSDSSDKQVDAAQSSVSGQMVSFFTL